MINPKSTESGRQALNAIEARIYRAHAIVATTAAARVNASQEGLELRGSLEAASELLLKIASDVEFVGR